MDTPKTVFEIFTQYGHLAFISMLFGVGNFVKKVQNKSAKLAKFDFFSELLFALMAGYVTFKLSIKFGCDADTTAILIAVNSYCGSKFLDAVQKITVKWLVRKIHKELGSVINEDDKENSPT